MERSVGKPLDSFAVVLMTMICAVWGGAFVAIKINLLDMPPFAASSLRFSLTAAVLFLFARLQHLRLWYGMNEMKLVFLLAVLFFYINVSLYVGTAHTTSGRATVFFYSQPIFFAVLAHYTFPDEHLTVRKMRGLCAALFGLVFLFLGKIAGENSSSLFGDCLVLSSALATAGQNLIMKRSAGRIHPVALIFWGGLVSGVLLAVCSVALEGNAPVSFSFRAVLALLYLSLISAAVGFVVFAWLIQRYSATSVTALVFLAPMFGVFFGGLVLRETLTAVQLFGVACVCWGVYMVTSQENRSQTILSPGQVRMKTV